MGPCLEARVKKLTGRETFTVGEVVSVLQRIDMRIPERFVVMAQALVNGAIVPLATRLEYYATMLEMCKTIEIEE